MEKCLSLAGFRRRIGASFGALALKQHLLNFTDCQTTRLALARGYLTDTARQMATCISAATLARLRQRKPMPSFALQF